MIGDVCCRRVICKGGGIDISEHHGTIDHKKEAKDRQTHLQDHIQRCLRQDADKLGSIFASRR